MPSPYAEIGLGRNSILNTKEVRAYQSILKSESKKRHIRVKSQVLPTSDGKKALEPVTQKALQYKMQDQSSVSRNRAKSPFPVATFRTHTRPLEKSSKIRRPTVKSININIAITNSFNTPGVAKNAN